MPTATNAGRPKRTSPSIGRHSVGVEFRQQVNRTRHEPTPAEVAKAASDRWYRIPKYDVAPSDRLSIHLSGRFEHRQSKRSGGTTGQLEVWLAQILQEIEFAPTPLSRSTRPPSPRRSGDVVSIISTRPAGRRMTEADPVTAGGPAPGPRSSTPPPAG